MMIQYNRFKAGVLALLLVMAVPPTSHATVNKTVIMAAGAGLLAVGASIGVYGISGWALVKAMSKFRNEDVYKNSLFFRFYPEDRLICAWKEKKWPLLNDMKSFVNENKQRFEDMIKKAANGNYIVRYSGSQFYLIYFHNDIQYELNMIKNIRGPGLLIAKTLAFGLRDKAKGWLNKLDVYEKRLGLIQKVLLGMKDFDEQTRTYQKQNYVLMAQQGGNLNVNLKV